VLDIPRADVSPEPGPDLPQAEPEQMPGFDLAGDLPDADLAGEPFAPPPAWTPEPVAPIEWPDVSNRQDEPVGLAVPPLDDTLDDRRRRASKSPYPDDWESAESPPPASWPEDEKPVQEPVAPQAPGNEAFPPEAPPFPTVPREPGVAPRTAQVPAVDRGFGQEGNNGEIARKIDELLPKLDELTSTMDGLADAITAATSRFGK